MLYTKTKNKSIVLYSEGGSGGPGGGTGGGGSGTAAPLTGLPEWIQILLDWLGV